MLGAFDGGRLVGSARFHQMRQWWHGRSMPMAGVGGVKVAPEYRGRGVGRALMNGLIPELVARGYPVSTLYPATAPLYRSLGWELAGARHETTVPMPALARLLAPDQAATGQAAGSAVEPGRAQLPRMACGGLPPRMLPLWPRPWARCTGRCATAARRHLALAPSPSGWTTTITSPIWLTTAS